MNIPWRDAAFPAAFVVHVDIAREIILGFFIIRNARVVVMDFDAYRILLSVFCGSIPVVGCWLLVRFGWRLELVGVGWSSWSVLELGSLELASIVSFVRSC